MNGKVISEVLVIDVIGKSKSKSMGWNRIEIIGPGKPKWAVDFGGWLVVEF
jgi:hypothetical protein